MEVNFGPKVICSDPCYSRDEWCMSEVDVVPGEWNIEMNIKEIEDWGRRVKSITAILAEKGKGTVIMIEDDVGVDSGQFGFFDESIYRTYDSFYDECVDVVISEELGGVIADGKGFVSRAGFGDGGYTLTIHNNVDGKAEKLEIVFIE